MKKWKPLMLHIEYESGPEQLIRQDSGYAAPFELHQRDANRNPYWTRVYSRTSSLRWQDFMVDTSMFYSNEGGLRVEAVDSSSGTVTFSNPGLFTIGDPTIQLRPGHTITATRPEPVQGLTSGVAIREMQNREQLSQRFPSHRDHVRSHQEAINQMAAAQAQMMADRSEMQRRAEQRRAEQQRIEQERTRQRRPWERVRNFFGQD
jgi:hypothetical protein